jgi:hypothetical protein
MNEEGFFEVMISGKGNFTQLNAPEIKWPKGIEGFAPIIKDSMDKMKFPLEGFRIFRYPFIASKPGNYELPAIRFSFFESNAKQYKTASSLTQQVLVSNKILKTATPDIQKSDIGKKMTGQVVSLYCYSLVYCCRVGLLDFCKKKNKRNCFAYRGNTGRIYRRNIVASERGTPY